MESQVVIKGDILRDCSELANAIDVYSLLESFSATSTALSIGSVAF